MGKVFGLLMMVLCVYVVSQLYLGETPFGLGSGDTTANKAVKAQSTVQRAGAKVENALEAGTARLERMLPED